MDNNNYYKYVKPYYETPEYVEPSNNEKYKSITNISQLSNHYIRQPKSNEFIIGFDDEFWCLLFFCLVECGFFTGLIFILIYDKNDNKSIGAIIFGIIFTGFQFVIILWGILTSIIRQKFIITDDYIQIKAYYILCCLNKNEIHNYMNIKNFQVDIQTKRNSDGDEIKINYIVCMDIFNKMK